MRSIIHLLYSILQCCGVENDSLQVGFVNGLSLADLQHRAMEHLSSLK